MTQSTADNPWAPLSRPERSSTLTTRRVDASHAQEFFWSLDYKGCPGLLVNTNANRSPNIQLPKFSELNVEIGEQRNGKGLFLYLALVERSAQDIFRTICHDLRSATEQISNAHGNEAIQAIVKRLIRWQELLKVPYNNTLSFSAIVGLYGELLILRDLFLPNLSPQVVMEAWQGPLGSAQDFVVHNCLIEVKSQLASSSHHVRISSIEQLDNNAANLYLIHQKIAPVEVGVHEGISLQSLVDSLRRSIKSDRMSTDLFERSLLERGYANNEVYDKVHYMLLSRQSYSVRDEFPRLVRDQVPRALRSANYSLDLALCGIWKIDEECLLDEIRPK